MFVFSSSLDKINNIERERDQTTPTWVNDPVIMSSARNQNYAIKIVVVSI